MSLNPVFFLLGAGCFSLSLTLLAEPSEAAATKPETVANSIAVNALNPLNTPRKNATTLIPLSLIAPLTGNKVDTPVLTRVNGQMLANQIIDSNKDGTQDALLVIADYPPKGSIRIEISKPAYGQLALHYPAKTQAEMAMRIGGKQAADGVYSGGSYYPIQQMAVPPSHKIGDKLFKYEGFGWESDLVAYRYYFDERGLVDIFGKRTDELVLARVGLDGGDYHTLSDWGMDILKVGPSLGLGGVAAWRKGKVQHPAPTTQSVELHNGPLDSSALLKQSDWALDGGKLELTRHFSIRAHSHLTHVQLIASKPIAEVAIGIVKHGVTRLKYLEPDSEWNYLATFGQQSLANDALGMALFFRHRDLQKATTDDFNELAILKMNTHAEYYFGARWEGETNSLRNAEDYQAYLNQVRLELNNPVAVTLIKEAP